MNSPANCVTSGLLEIRSPAGEARGAPLGHLLSLERRERFTEARIARGGVLHLGGELLATLAGIKRNDTVVLSNGMIGKVVRVEDKELGVEIAQGVTVKVVRSMISEVRTKGDPAPGQRLQELILKTAAKTVG